MRCFLFALAALAATPANAQSADTPTVTQPPESAQVEAGAVYVEVEVYESENFEVWLREDQEDPAVDVTSSFTFSADVAGTKERYHANLELPVGTHEVWAVQYKASDPGNSWQSNVRVFTRAAGAVSEPGALTGADGGTAGQVVGQTIGGAVERPSPSSDLALVFGDTDLNGGTDPPSTIAFSTDTDPSDGLSTSYYDESGLGTIEAALGLVTGEVAIEPAASFVDGSEVCSYYWRVHTSAVRELGLACMTGGTPPYVRETFSNTSAVFGDTYSLFEDGELQPGRGAVVSGSDLYLYGLHEPGGATSQEVFAARVALNAVTTASSYEYWTGTSWASAPVTPLSLWANSGPPSVAFNASEGRWVAVHSVEQGLVMPYGVTDDHSALAVRVAENLEGPWTAPVVVWERPQTVLAGPGSSHTPVILPGLASGSTITVAANDGGEWTRPENAYLYEIDLSALIFPPALDVPAAPTTDNPYDATGFARSGDTVRVFVNGEDQGTTTAASDGSFSLPLVLGDGANLVYAQAEAGAMVSDPSETVTIEYENAESRSVSGTISQDTVWTPGQAPGTTGPYVVTGTVTIASGVSLILLEGVEIEVDGANNILVDGTLEVRGTSGSPVTIGPDTPVGTSDWPGIDIRNGGTGIFDHVEITNATSPIEVVGGASGGTLELSNALIDTFQLYGVRVANGSDAALSDVTIQNGSTVSTGIKLTNTGAVTIDATSVTGSRDGLEVQKSSPLVTASTFTSNGRYGVNVLSEGDPVIGGQSQITNNGSDGVHIVGAFNAALDPAPVVNDTDITGNGGNAVDAANFASAASTVLDFSGNWWGGTDAEAIADEIDDASDTLNAPVVAFTPFLDASALGGGIAVFDSFLNGPLAPGSVGTSTAYTVVGNLLVPSGQSLTIPAGAQLMFLPGTRLTAEGTLHIAGSPTQPVVFESAEDTPTSGAWDGIYIESTSTGSIVEHAIIDHAHHGVDVTGTSATIRDNTIRDFGRSTTTPGAGVRLEASASLVEGNDLHHDLGHGGINVYGIQVDDDGTASGSAPVVHDNTITGLDYGIRVEAPASGVTASPTILANVVEDNVHTGIYLYRATEAAVTGNTVRGNTLYGVYLAGGNSAAASPKPVITQNVIEQNGSFAGRDLYTISYGGDATTVEIDATENWWGTAVISEIPDQITDATDATSRPFVDFAPPLDGEGGSPVVGNFLSGPTGTGFVASTGNTYDVVGALQVDAGETLTVEAGATLRFLDGTGLDVQGTLVASGGTFTSANTSPSRGDWDGIHFGSSSTGSSLSGATILWAEDPVTVDGAEVDLLGLTIDEIGFVAVRYENGATGTISGSTIGHSTGAQGSGIVIVDSSPTITGNEVKYVSVGIDLLRSSPLVTGNYLHHNSIGLEINAESNPTVSGGNVITDNLFRGIAILGNNVEADNPAPVIHGNEIADNNVHLSNRYNLSVSGFGGAGGTIDATLNDWGLYTLAGIAAEISATSPASVDYDPYLDASGQPVGGGNVLNGTISSNFTVTASPDPSWTILGDVVVASGVTLTVEAGVDIQVVPGAALNVDGVLDVQGSSGTEAVFRSAETTPTSGSWDGIFLRSGSGASSIDYAVIRHARHGVDADGASGVVSVTNSAFEDFGRILAFIPGVGVRIAGGTQATVEDNTFSHQLGGSTLGIHGIQLHDAHASTTVGGNTVEDLDHGIEIVGCDPSVQDNTLQDNRVGLLVGPDADPTVDGGNVITANEVGVLVEGENTGGTDPDPVVTGNDIFANTTWNVQTSAFGGGDKTLDFTGNWWGSTSIPAIAATIYDRSDAPVSLLPWVDFSSFLDDSVGNAGQAVSGNHLVGVVGSSTSLSASTTYEALGLLLVPSGETLTIPQGATLEMVAGSELRVRGGLSVQGTLGTEVTFTSAEGSPAAGDWTGVVVEAGSGTVAIDHAIIEYATIGADLFSAATVSNSTIRDFESAGIRVTGVAGTISDNTILPLGASVGIELVDASPAIDDNDITGPGIGSSTATGILASGGSDPLVTDNTITGLLTGIELQGSGSAATNPDPTVNGNTISGNGTSGTPRNLVVTGYFYPGITDRLDFTGNDWGTAVVSEILAGIVQDSAGTPVVVDVSDFLDGGTPVIGPVFTNTIRSVSKSVDRIDPGLSDTVRIDFVVEVPSTVTVTFWKDIGTTYDAQNQVAQLVAAPGVSFVEWDGRDSGNAIVPDGGYTYTLTATDGTNTGIYEPSRTSVPSSRILSTAICPSVEISAYENDYWVCDHPVPNAGNLELSVGVQGLFAGTPVWTRPYEAGTHTLTWDVRDASGAPVEGNALIIGTNYEFRPNSVVVRVNATVVSGGGAAPTPVVKSDPWLVTHSYEQTSQIVYRLDEEARVTVKLLPPGVYDPGDASAIVLVDDVLQSAVDGSMQPIDHTVAWTGHSPSDENSILTEDEGPFTFTIEATSEATGFTSLTRGSLQLRR